jgi:predicted protein tyrosine phosphatase
LRILFICSQNKLRSPTAEHVYASYPGIECSSAGLNHDAENPVTGELLEWAELIVVMESAHKRRLTQRFKRHLAHAHLICLNIPDDFNFMQPELIDLLKLRMARHLP